MSPLPHITRCACLVAVAVCGLLLAGCARAPKPTEIPLREAEISISESAHPEIICSSGVWSQTISGTTYARATSKIQPLPKLHYKGGAWCNVWADNKGIHWEACK